MRNTCQQSLGNATIKITNAPANVKSPLDLGDTPSEEEKEALAKYIWEFFDRTIATR